MENIETGLLLMVVGMTTVFAILLIVIYLGKGLIVLVNKYAPEEIIAKKPVAAAVRVQTATPTQTTAIGSLSGQVLFLNYYSSTLLEFHRKVTVIYLNFQPYKRRKKHVRVFGKSRTCFSENTYMFF